MKALFNSIRKRLNHTYRIQVLSDLHLEVGQQYSTFTFPASAPFLLLAGDIGRLIDYDAYLGFLEAQVARYKQVFLVLGNHEFYGLDYESGLNAARRFAEEPSLADAFVLLHRTRWDDTGSDLTILGCTLWSAIPEDAYAIVESKINDFKKINQWTAHEHNRVHAEEVSWLREQVALLPAKTTTSEKQRQLLVATHHAPSIEGTSRPYHTNNPWTPAFATDLVDQGGWEGVKTWVFGHTHYSTRLVRNGIKLVANQRGYVLPGLIGQRGEGPKTNNALEFDPTMVISV